MHINKNAQQLLRREQNMNKKIIALALTLFTAQSASAVVVDWTDWQTVSAEPDTVVGSINGVTVTYTGDYAFVQTGVGTNYWTENGSPAPYTESSVVDNAPTASEMIALNYAASNVITFSEAILNPVMAIVSMGQPNLAVSYDFDTDFTVLSSGVGYWSYANGGLPGTYIEDDAQDILTGYEFHGVIQFNGLISQISWTSTSENWHGITVGAPTASVPEPASLALLGLGLAGFGFLRRKKV